VSRVQERGKERGERRDDATQDASRHGSAVKRFEVEVEKKVEEGRDQRRKSGEIAREEREERIEKWVLCTRVRLPSAGILGVLKYISGFLNKRPKAI